jgi:hypothetical protein
MENNIKIWSPQQFKMLRTHSINEKSNPDAKHEYGCIMGAHKAIKLFDNIDADDVYDNEEGKYGIETEPHITLLYGLHDKEIDKDEIILLLQCLELPTVEITEINLFENEKFDVLKYEIKSDKLTLMNKMITSMFPFTSDFPDYHAHSTIAYLKPGTGKKYAKKLDKSIEVKLTGWLYSQANGEKTEVVNDKVEVIKKKGSDEHTSTK